MTIEQLQKKETGTIFDALKGVIIGIIGWIKELLGIKDKKRE